jgi:phage FluMu protein Com
VGYPRFVPETQPAAAFDVECPHCHKTFSATMIEGSAARYRGFKCPHCKLFVPYQRAADRDLLEPLSRDADAVD